MGDFLKTAVSLKKKEICALKIKKPMVDFVDSKGLSKGIRHFREAISTQGRVNLIAEIKRTSPSRKKRFFRKFSARGLAEIYARNGAKAISVLTDRKFFGGSILDISEVRKAVNLPVLRKDFIIDEYQIYESRYFGADAILLIASILTKEEIRGFMHLAKRIGMDSVVEVHNEEDLEKTLLTGAKIVGINNRNLGTLEIDFNTTLRLVQKIHGDIIKVSESGIKTDEEVSVLRKIGVDAVLIGASFLEAEDIGRKVRMIMRGNKL